MESQTEQFKKALFGLVKHIKADFEHRLKESGCTLTPLQYGVLRKLSAESITLNDLSKYLGMKPPSLTPVVDSLVKGNLATRKQDKDDRRKAQLIVTPKGSALLSKIPLKAGAGIVRDAFGKMGKGKSAELVALLHELTEIIEK